MQPGSPNETVNLWSGNPNKTVFDFIIRADFWSQLACFVLFSSWPYSWFLYLSCTLHQHVYVYSKFRWGTGIICRLINTGTIKFWSFFFYILQSYCTYCSALGLLFWGFFCIMSANFKWQGVWSSVSHISQCFFFFIMWSMQAIPRAIQQ